MNYPDEIQISWHIMDITEQAKHRDIIITDEQARHILQLLKHRHSADIGINWDVIDIYTDNYLESINKYSEKECINCGEKFTPEPHDSFDYCSDYCERHHFER